MLRRAPDFECRFYSRPAQLLDLEYGAQARQPALARRPVRRLPCSTYCLLSVVEGHPACVNLVQNALDPDFLIRSQVLWGSARSGFQKVCHLKPGRPSKNSAHCFSLVQLTPSDTRAKMIPRGRNVGVCFKGLLLPCAVSLLEEIEQLLAAVRHPELSCRQVPQNTRNEGYRRACRGAYRGRWCLHLVAPSNRFNRFCSKGNAD